MNMVAQLFGSAAFFERALETIALGGPLMAPLAAVCALAWALLAERLLWYAGQDDAARFGNEVAALLAGGDRAAALGACRARKGMGARAAARFIEATGAGQGSLEAAAEEAASRELPAARRGFSTIAVLSSAAPLLGLLGTVTGMITTFRAITEFGMGNPRSLAEGVSEALITTEAGLIVAIPTLILHNWLKHRGEHLVRSAQDLLIRLRAIAGSQTKEPDGTAASSKNEQFMQDM